MQNTRRNFLVNSTMTALSLGWCKGIMDFQNAIHTDTGIDWDHVRQLFPVRHWNKIHFNSGSAGVMPLPVQENLFDLIKIMNSQAPYVAWSDWQSIKSMTTERIARILETSVEELMIVRNTTEALNMIVFGLPIGKGDEVVAATHDYPFALNALRQRQRRDGIVLVLTDVVLPMDDDDLVAAYEAMITPATKAILVTFMTHRHGHILPVKKITEMAHGYGVQVIVDGAHAFAHFGHSLSDLGVDYYASSLHKWLNAPHGCGLLYVKKEHISQLHAHPSSNPEAQDQIDKYEHLGTRAFHQEIGIQAALDFHQQLGPKEKQERLHQLKKHWVAEVSEIAKVNLHTDPQSDKSCAVATFSVNGLTGGRLVKVLDSEYGIHAKSVGGSWGSGVRISVNVFTNHDDLDQLVGAIKQIAQKV